MLEDGAGIPLIPGLDITGVVAGTETEGVCWGNVAGLRRKEGWVRMAVGTGDIIDGTGWITVDSAGD